LLILKTSLSSLRYGLAVLSRTFPNTEKHNSTAGLLQERRTNSGWDFRLSVDGVARQTDVDIQYLVVYERCGTSHLAIPAATARPPRWRREIWLSGSVRWYWCLGTNYVTCVLAYYRSADPPSADVRNRKRWSADGTRSTRLGDLDILLLISRIDLHCTSLLSVTDRRIYTTGRKATSAAMRYIFWALNT